MNTYLFNKVHTAFKCRFFMYRKPCQFKKVCTKFNYIFVISVGYFCVSCTCTCNQENCKQQLGNDKQ